MEKEFKLEVGKKYAVRDPDYVKKYGFPTEVIIIKNDGDYHFPMIGDDEDCYEINGSQDYTHCSSPYDLVKEVI